MKKLIVAAMAGVLALGFMAGSVKAAPGRVSCTGTASVWDDTDIVHLTVPTGSGNDQISWRARGHTTLTCDAGSPLNGQIAQIEQRVQARWRGSGLEGKAQTRVSVGGQSHVFEGRYTGTTTVNQGVVSVSGVVDAGDYLVWRLNMHQHGTIDLGTRQWTGIYIDDIIIGLVQR